MVPVFHYTESLLRKMMLQTRIKYIKETSNASTVLLKKKKKIKTDMITIMIGVISTT